MFSNKKKKKNAINTFFHNKYCSDFSGPSPLMPNLKVHWLNLVEYFNYVWRKIHKLVGWLQNMFAPWQGNVFYCYVKTEVQLFPQANRDLCRHAPSLHLAQVTKLLQRSWEQVLKIHSWWNLRPKNVTVWHYFLPEQVPHMILAPATFFLLAWCKLPDKETTPILVIAHAKAGNIWNSDKVFSTCCML